MQGQTRILIVDDHPANLEVLQEMLGEHFQLRAAASGQEALEIAPEFQPAIILLDIMMPGIDGYETCRRMRTNPELRHTKIIMVSAKAMLSERLKGYDAGADDYVTKPFSEDELMAKVRVYQRLKTVEEVDELKSDLLLLLKHETRTPLNGIFAPVEVLLSDEGVGQEERRMFLNMVLQSAKRLQDLFEKVLMLCAMKSGMWEAQFAAGDLCDVVRDAVDDVGSRAVEQNVKIDQDLPDSAPTMLDLRQMRQVVATMLDNAIRFSPSDGHVAVGVSRDNGSLFLSVTDHGKGIDPDFLPHVFEEFAAADIAHHGEGQGLSLAIARQTVEAHGGTIGAESRKGSGTTFTVRLPIVEPSP